MQNDDNIIILNDEIDKIKDPGPGVSRIKEQLNLIERFKLNGVMSKALRAKIEAEAEYHLKKFKENQELDLQRLKDFASASLTNLNNELASNVRQTLELIVNQTELSSTERVSTFEKNMLQLIEKVQDDETYQKFPEQQTQAIERIKRRMNRAIEKMEVAGEEFTDRIKNTW